MKAACLILSWAFAVAGAGPSFEVASVKPSADADGRTWGIRPGGRFIAKSVTLRTLISLAYNVREDRISGGPEWINTETWNIEAKADSTSASKWPDSWPFPAVADDPVRPSLESLIEDRFQLKARRETKDAPIYEITVAKNGSKLKPTEGRETVGRGAPRGSMLFNFYLGYIAGNGISVAGLAQGLGEQGALGRPVIDKTGLTGSYDFILEWAPGPELRTPPPNVPALSAETAATRSSIFVALQEQLGLKVEAAKGPVAAVIIGHVEKPSAN